MSTDLGADATAKDILREQLLAARKQRLAGLTPEARSHQSQVLAAAVLASPIVATALESAEPVASYLPLPSEPDTSAFHETLLARGVRVLVPECTTNDLGEPTLAWIELNPQEATVAMAFDRDERGIPIPTGQAVGIGARGLADNNCHTLLLPALAVSPVGERLGKGAGYYDRLLDQATQLGSTLKTVAVVFANEQLPSVPTEAHDAKVTGVVAV